ncbi:hypothetical protein ACIQWA_33625 [Kitasatospora sp. NPDC098652]|uniref:hypothetical protein n=1 Tax=Kitasatospora sp. NPDC098652 TaxID=3364095 RepID=UPI0037F9DD53
MVHRIDRHPGPRPAALPCRHAEPPGAREVHATVCHPGPGPASADFPALPVRTGEDVRVWFGRAEQAPTWPHQRLRLEPVTG